ncbi:unnamed protein product, partial [Staurois parvus]
MQAGRRTKHLGQNYWVNVTFLKFLNFQPGSIPPYVPTLTGNGTQKTDAGIGRRRWLGTLQGGHRGSAGQGKCCRVIPEQPQGNPECNLGLPLLV